MPSTTDPTTLPPTTPAAVATFNPTRLLDDRALYDLLLAPNELANVMLEPEDRTGRNETLVGSYPADTRLCEGVSYTFKGLVHNAYRSIDDGSAATRAGSEGSAFRGDGAATMLATISGGVERCGMRIRYDKVTPNGRVLALVVPWSENQEWSFDRVYIRRGLVVVEVDLLNKSGSHSADADTLVDLVVRRLEFALS